jgi:hypothetical protein
MKTWMWLWMVALGLAVAGCPTERGSDDDDDSAATSDDDDATTDDDDAVDDDDVGPDDDDVGPDDDDSGEGPVSTFFTGFVFEPETNEGIEGADVVILQDTSYAGVTEDDGGYGIKVLDLEEADLRASATGFTPVTVIAESGINIDPSSGLLHFMVPPAVWDELAELVGTVRDNSLSLVMVSVVDSAGDVIAGTAFSLSTDHEGSFILGEGEPQGGDTTTAQRGTVGFINVANEKLEVDFDEPAGMDCDGRTSFETQPGEVVSVTYVCR